MSAAGDKPKIIIDEDWKSQVQAEKEKAASAPAPPAAAPEESPDLQLPPASLSFLLTTLATQAMIALGQVPNPITSKVELRLPQAKHYIDMLAMLEEKTTANRTADESAILTELLHQLRLAYVLTQQDALEKPAPIQKG